MTIWREKVRERYPWARIQDKLDELLFELSKAEDEETVELSSLSLLFGNQIDLSFFTKKEQRKIKKLLLTLISDTKRHEELLAQAIYEITELKKQRGS